jgi:hypothetical protein
MCFIFQKTFSLRHGFHCRVLWRGDFDSVTTRETKIHRYIEFYNQNAKPMKWNFYPKKENANAPVGVKEISVTLCTTLKIGSKLYPSQLQTSLPINVT